MKEIWGMWDNFGIFYPLIPPPPGDKNDPPSRFFPPVTFFWGGGWDSIPPASHPVRMGALTLPPSLPNMPSNELWKPPPDPSVNGAAAGRGKRKEGRPKLWLLPSSAFQRKKRARHPLLSGGERHWYPSSPPPPRRKKEENESKSLSHTLSFFACGSKGEK